jgi:cytochrome c biogenesis protein CcdA/thiol-disulfide isomerase/thioredoxin
MIQILFALLAGVLTIAAPCILPMLPILLGSSVGQQSKQRPLLIVSGFVVSFASAALFLSFIIQNLGVSPDSIRNVAVFILAIFAVLMIWPHPFELLTTKMSGLINKANQAGSGSGNLSGLILGLVLGIIWTPCAGPVLGAILTLIATQTDSGKASLLLIAYAIGAGIPMLIITYGSQYITTKVRWLAQYSKRLQQVFGVLVLLLAIAMHFQYDTKIQSKLIEYFPAIDLESKLIGNKNPLMPGDQKSIIENNTIYNSATGPLEEKPTDKINLKNFGPAPDFTGIENWLNLPAGKQTLTMSELKGKVVLVDFWTYSCINCIRTMPYINKWYETYKDKGLVIVGVHTPEFAFEKVKENVETAIKRFEIKYPVAQDNNFGTWSAYNNRYWPAKYLINKDGDIVYTHFGEGNYTETENIIRQLLETQGANSGNNNKNDNYNKIKSPEMYFGTSRLEFLTQAQEPSGPIEGSYIFPDKLKLNNFALQGQWQFSPEKITSLSKNAKIRLRFYSGKLFMVASSQKPITLNIVVDGVRQPDVIISASQLYTIYDSNNYSEHTVEITSPEAGLEAFTFTFG